MAVGTVQRVAQEVLRDDAFFEQWGTLAEVPQRYRARLVEKVAASSHASSMEVWRELYNVDAAQVVDPVAPTVARGDYRSTGHRPLKGNGKFKGLGLQLGGSDLTPPTTLSGALELELARTGCTEVVQTAQQQWTFETFSDPNAHDKNDYTYIVHSLNTFSVDEEQTLHGDVRANLLRHPERAAELSILSTSVVSADRPMTFGSGIGLILRVPKANIIAAHPVDLQTHGIRKALQQGDLMEAAKKTVGKFTSSGLPSPEDSLEQTPADYYNEVLVTGTAGDNEQLEVVGFFTKEMGGIDMISLMYAEAYEQLRTLASDRQLPVIKFSSGTPNVERLKDFGWE